MDAALKDSIRKLSSFDKYKGEVFSGNLDWTPMHKDPVFWRENITKFEENDYQVDSTILLFQGCASENVNPFLGHASSHSLRIVIS